VVGEYLLGRGSSLLLLPKEGKFSLRKRTSLNLVRLAGLAVAVVILTEQPVKKSEGLLLHVFVLLFPIPIILGEP
jgi:hypothetical protein